MTARIAGFISRAEAGLRAPRSISRRISPANGGAAPHYGGPAQRIAEHATCLRRWKAWQDYHMDSHGWADIAYTGGYCDHGYALAGRGAGVRTAANGTNAGNDSYYGVVWIGGQGETPTQAALDALDWWVLELRTHGGAGDRVVPHQVFTGTQCPGTPLIGRAQQLDRQPISADGPAVPPPVPSPTPPPAPRPQPIVPPYPGLSRQGMRNSRATRAYQQRLRDRGWRIVVDGDHGPATTAVLRAFQAEKRLVADGVGGQNTWRALWTAQVTR